MMLKAAVLGTLGLALVVPSVASAGHDDDLPGRILEIVLAKLGDKKDGKREHHCDRDDCETCHPERAKRVWVEGHYESREVRCVIPAVTREVWIPERCEEIRIPAVTERVCIPAVMERVWCPPVMERVWVPEVRERVFVPGHYETRRDSRGCVVKIWIAGHHEERIVCAGRYEERCVKPGRFDERCVRPERYETRIVTPERCETRVIERARCETIVVRPERTEVTVEKVWVPAHWEKRSDRSRA